MEYTSVYPVSWTGLEEKNLSCNKNLLLYKFKRGIIYAYISMYILFVVAVLINQSNAVDYTKDKFAHWIIFSGAGWRYIILEVFPNHNVGWSWDKFACNHLHVACSTWADSWTDISVEEVFPNLNEGWS